MAKSGQHPSRADVGGQRVPKPTKDAPVEKSDSSAKGGAQAGATKPGPKKKGRRA